MRGAGDGVGESREERSFILSFGMAHITVAANARDSVAVRGAACNPRRKEGAGIYLVSDLRMTMPARVLSHRAAAGLHGNRLMEIAGRESVGMPKTVVRLRPVFTHEVVRRMAIVAGGHRAVARLHPGIIMVLHDMAVRARFRVVREVRSATGVDERVTTNSCRQSKQHPRCDRCGPNSSARIHSRFVICSPC